LHRIEGLSENFLYFNDDFLLRQSISKSDFFTAYGRQTKFFYSRGAFIPLQKHDDLMAVDLGAINNATLLATLVGYRPLRKFQHTPYALKKSVIEKLEHRAPELFIRNSKSRFRDFSDYSILSLLHHYGYYLGTAQASTIQYNYINLQDDLAGQNLKELIYNHRRFSCVCINDVDSDDNSDSSFFEPIMETIYYYKSIAER
jgi:hypothetical protein